MVSKFAFLVYASTVVLLLLIVSVVGLGNGAPLSVAIVKVKLSFVMKVLSLPLLIESIDFSTSRSNVARPASVIAYSLLNVTLDVV